MQNKFKNHPQKTENINNEIGPLILVGDIGGTKTNMGLFSGPIPNLRLLKMRTYPSQTAPSAIALIEKFLKDTGQKKLSRACFGVAGPVIDGVAQIVKLPWEVSESEIKSHYNWTNVSVVNDLVATICSVPYLKPNQLEALDESTLELRPGNIGLLAAGTGLGMALLIDDNGRYVACASEGGHRDFAARSDVEYRLHQFLKKKYGHVSVDHVLSGQGLADLYDFINADQKLNEPAGLNARFKAEDKSAVVSQIGLTGQDQVCTQALSMFVEIYGAEAGNLALQGTTLGGIYLGGGIAPKIASALHSPSFRQAFSAKGRLSGFLNRVPLRLISDCQSPLWGAAVYSLAYFP